MKPLNFWHRVGPPTRKRSGTLVFAAVIGVLLVAGTAMAANLGLLTSTAARDRGYRLDVPRPPLSVTLPTTEPSPPTVDSTSAPENDIDDVDVDDDGDADADLEDEADTETETDSTVMSTLAERPINTNSNGSGDETGDGETGDGAESTSDREADDDSEDAADPDDADDSSSKRESGQSAGQRAVAGEPSDDGGSRLRGDGSLDDD